MTKITRLSSDNRAAVERLAEKLYQAIWHMHPVRRKAADSASLIRYSPGVVESIATDIDVVRLCLERLAALAEEAGKLVAQIEQTCMLQRPS